MNNSLCARTREPLQYRLLGADETCRANLLAGWSVSASCISAGVCQPAVRARHYGFPAGSRRLKILVIRARTPASAVRPLNLGCSSSSDISAIMSMIATTRRPNQRQQYQLESPVGRPSGVFSTAACRAPSQPSGTTDCTICPPDGFGQTTASPREYCKVIMEESGHRSFCNNEIQLITFININN